ncbi:hypothetical protein [uncultured Maricaulis sp.]|uniref:hypothetical protein n=1 Tax=uncultured Maricaulis sp. TaxID=174710 RepID=UPI0030DC8C7E|tara:strand:+ start:10733 stop:11275 length:543 start_codon:yes stop_codon:yes gene_type:complete
MTEPSHFDVLADAAERYGRFSLDNYAHVRNVAESVSSGFCRYLSGGEPVCVYLVPPTGEWAPQAYQSGAFSVSGTGFLPLDSISFGLAVRVSRTGDWLRVVLTCTKKGPEMEIEIENGSTFALELPVRAEQLVKLYDTLFEHLTVWFSQQADFYENGDYGDHAIGFEFLHKPEDAAGPVR